MKKCLILSTGLCVIIAFTSCKSSESAYKKAYEQAKQQELAQPQVSEPVEVTPVVTTPTPTTTVVSTPATETTPSANESVREEKVTMVSGDGLKTYSVVCGSFGVKTNADSLKEWLDKEGYNAIVVFSPERNMYRVVSETFDDKASAAQARDALKARYPNREDFQGAWLLYRLF